MSYWSTDNERRRLMLWEGQTPDGKKHREALGKAPFPWEDASDTRVPLLDGIINDLTHVNLAAMTRAQLRCEATELSDEPGAQQLGTLLNFYRRLLRRELKREGELISQYGQTDGYAIWQVGWDEAWAYETKTITLEQIQQIEAQTAQQSGGQPGIMAAMILDPSMEDIAVQHALRFIPALETTKTARAFVKSLRTDGTADWEEPYKVRNRPAVTGRRIGYDIFIPPETTDLQTAPVIYVVEWLNEAQVRVKGAAEEWPAAFTEAVLKTVGRTSSWTYLNDPVQQVKAGHAVYATQDTKDRRIEILYAYTKPADEEGRTGVWLTVFSPHIRTDSSGRSPLFGLHERVNYLGDVYPFAPYTREALSRRLTASRGVPEIASTWQNELKTQHDMLADRTSIEINPAIRVPNRMGQQYRIGPGVQLKARSGEIESVEPIKGSPQLAFEVMHRIDLQAANYFGQMHPEVLPAKWQLAMQVAADRFLQSVEEVFGLVLMLVLAPELMPRDELERITGVQLQGDLSRQAIARKFDCQVAFDVRDLDMDWVMKKLKTFAETVLPLDRGGLVDSNKLVSIVANSVDPQLAQALIKSPGEASARLHKEVEDDLAQMRLGNERQYVEEDPTAQTKLQFLQQIIGDNPDYQQALQDKQGRFAQLVENYVKNLTMSVQQTQVNPQIGRTGVKAVGQQQ